MPIYIFTTPAVNDWQKKVDVMVLAKISGHRDLSILQNTYYAPDMAEGYKTKAGYDLTPTKGLSQRNFFLL